MNTTDLIDALKDGLIDEINQTNEDMSLRLQASNPKSYTNLLAKHSTLSALLRILEDISVKIELPQVEKEITLRESIKWGFEEEELFGNILEDISSKMEIPLIEKQIS